MEHQYGRQDVISKRSNSVRPPDGLTSLLEGSSNTPRCSLPQKLGWAPFVKWGRGGGHGYLHFLSTLHDTRHHCTNKHSGSERVNDNQHGVHVITPILKTLVILAIWLALCSVIYHDESHFFCLLQITSVLNRVILVLNCIISILNRIIFSLNGKISVFAYKMRC